jgi:hypothetical protein
VNRIHCQSQSGIKTRHDDIDVVVGFQEIFWFYFSSFHIITDTFYIL